MSTPSSLGSREYGYQESPDVDNRRLAKNITSFDLGLPAKAPVPGPYKGRPKTVSRYFSEPVPRDKEKTKALERSLKVSTDMLKKSYDVDDAARLEDAFFDELPSNEVARSASGPSVLGREAGVFSAQIRKSVPALVSKHTPETKLKFDVDKYFMYISRLLDAYDPGQLAEQVYEKLIETKKYAPWDTKTINYLQSVSEGLEAAYDIYESKHPMTAKESTAATQKREAGAADAARIVDERDEAKKSKESEEIAKRKEFVKAVQAKIMAEMKAASAGAGTAGGRRRIYTLRSHRRNVRNQAKRRTRKGLLRQGSRPHRKTRRRS